MIEAISRFFQTRIAGPVADQLGARDENARERAYQLATAALLIEMSRADHQVREVERAMVASAVKRAFDLSDSDTEDLVTLAELEASEATSLFEFTRLVKDQFDREERTHLVELLWEVAYADGHLDKYEEHLLRRIADLIYVPHSTFVRVKLEVQSRLERDGR